MCACIWVYMINGLYLNGAFLVLMTTCSTLQYSVAIHQSTHIHAVCLCEVLSLPHITITHCQYRVQDLSPKHYSMQNGGNWDRTAILKFWCRTQSTMSSQQWHMLLLQGQRNESEWSEEWIPLNKDEKLLQSAYNNLKHTARKNICKPLNGAAKSQN